MKRKLLIMATLSLATVAAIAGCKREAVPEVAPAVEPPPPTATATVDAAPANRAMEPTTALNTKAFAGTFSGTLPCADCPGTDTTLELRADGTATLREKNQRTHETEETGTWGAETDGTRIRFDPDSKAQRDRLYAVTSHDQITQLGSDGAPAAGGLDDSLTRDAARP